MAFVIIYYAVLTPLPCPVFRLPGVGGACWTSPANATLPGSAAGSAWKPLGAQSAKNQGTGGKRTVQRGPALPLSMRKMRAFFTKLITSALYCHFLLVFGDRFVLSFLSLTVERLAAICSRGLDSTSIVGGRSVQGDLSHRQFHGSRAGSQRSLFRDSTPTGLLVLLLS